MVVWRITPEAHAEQPLRGEGAKRYGGRWNHIGIAVVYTSESLSLAVLEYLVNLSISDLPPKLVSVQVKIPDDFSHKDIQTKALPANWRTFPATEELKDIGTDWVRTGSTPVLVVPSVVIPGEHNCLINPAHPLAKKIQVVSTEPFALDQRLYVVRKPARKK
jgi:RES domain-containing protein